jgi:hypothetical protein
VLQLDAIKNTTHLVQAEGFRGTMALPAREDPSVALGMTPFGAPPDLELCKRALSFDI